MSTSKFLAIDFILFTLLIVTFLMKAIPVFFILLVFYAIFRFSSKKVTVQDKYGTMNINEAMKNRRK